MAWSTMMSALAGVPLKTIATPANRRQNIDPPFSCDPCPSFASSMSRRQ
jgi:hypothetical protein